MASLNVPKLLWFMFVLHMAAASSFPPFYYSRFRQPRTPSSEAVLVLCFSGLNADYLDKHYLPHLHLLREHSSYPNTFLPEYPGSGTATLMSVATGLYPESHGVLASNVHDPKQGRALTERDPGFFTQNGGARPLWNVNELHGGVSACLMWPGCSVPFANRTPTYHVPDDEETSFRSLLDLMLAFATATFSSEQYEKYVVSRNLSINDTLENSYTGSTNGDGDLEENNSMFKTKYKVVSVGPIPAEVHLNLSDTATNKKPNNSNAQSMENLDLPEHDSMQSQLLNALASNMTADSRPQDVYYTMEAKAKANLIMIFWNEPDTTARNFGPDSNEMKEKLKSLDDDLKYLHEKLQQRGLFGVMDLVMLSDHASVPREDDTDTLSDDPSSASLVAEVATDLPPLTGDLPSLEEDLPSNGDESSVMEDIQPAEEDIAQHLNSDPLQTFDIQTLNESISPEDLENISSRDNLALGIDSDTIKWHSNTSSSLNNDDTIINITYVDEANSSSIAEQLTMSRRSAESVSRTVDLDLVLDPTLYSSSGESPLLHIWPNEGSEMVVLERLVEGSKRLNYVVRRKTTLPASLHFRDNPRIASILVEADEGYTFTDEFGQLATLAPWRGPNTPGLPVLFLAGPSFEEFIGGSMTAVDVYPLVLHLLAVEEVPPNNGSLLAASSMIKTVLDESAIVIFIFVIVVATLVALVYLYALSICKKLYRPCRKSLLHQVDCNTNDGNATCSASSVSSKKGGTPTKVASSVKILTRVNYAPLRDSVNTGHQDTQDNGKYTELNPTEVNRTLNDTQTGLDPGSGDTEMCTLLTRNK